MACACCSPSEWHWFRWVLFGQPVFAAGLYLWAYGF